MKTRNVILAAGLLICAFTLFYGTLCFQLLNDKINIVLEETAVHRSLCKIVEELWR